MMGWRLVVGCIVLLVLGNAEAHRTNTIFRKKSEYLPTQADDRLYPNLGIVFKEIAKLQTTREVYTIHLMTELPNVQQMMAEVTRPLTYSLLDSCPGPSSWNSLCYTHHKRFLTIKNYQKRIKDEFMERIKVLTQDMPVLESIIPKSRRPRRSNVAKAAVVGAIPFVGPAIVGAWAHHRIDELEIKVETLANATVDLYENQAKLAQGLSTLTNVTIKEFTKVYRNLRELRADLTNFARNCRARMRELSDNLRDSVLVGTYLSQMEVSLQDYYLNVGKLLDRLDEIFHELHLGYLPRVLISHQALQKMLKTAREAIAERYLGYDLVYTDAADYYNVPNVIATVVGYKLLVQLPAYVKKRNQAMFTLYRVHAVHVPYSVKTINQMPDSVKSYSYTKAQLGATHFAASIHDYMSISMELLMDCEKRGGIYICPQIFVHTNKQKVTCLSSVYWEHPFEEIKERCNYQYYHDATPEAVIYGNASHLLLANVGVPWSLICGNKAIPTRESGERYIVIDRRSLCQCALTTDLHYLPATITGCEGISPGITLSYPFNAVVQFHYRNFSQQLFDYTKVRQESDEEDVPGLVIAEVDPDTQVLSEEAKNLPVAMDRVFKMIDSKKETFLTQAEYLRSRQNVKTWFSGKSIIYGAILIMSIIGVIALVIVLCQMYQTGKVKTMVSSAVLGGVSALPTVRADDSESDKSPAELATQAALDRTYVVLITMCSLLLYYLLRKLFRKCVLYRHLLPSQNTGESVHESHLFMELASSTEVVRIFLITVRAAAIQILVPTPIVPEITNMRKTLCYTNITLDWGGKGFYLFDSEHPMQFPTIIPVPIYKRARLERIMKEIHSTRILVLQDVYYALDHLRGFDQENESEWSHSPAGSINGTMAAQLQAALSRRGSPENV